MSLVVKNLKKTYKANLGRSKFVAIKDVSIKIEPGEIYAIVGQNGAGKTTIIKCILNFIKRDSGEISFNDKDIIELMAQNKVGYLPENMSFPPLVSMRTYLFDIGVLKGMKNEDIMMQVNELTNRFKLTRFIDKPIDMFSKGMKKKVGFIQSVMNSPELLILDEPTDGLDPISRRLILDYLSNMAKNNCTILISSHILADLEIICNRVGIINNGVLLKDIVISKELLDNKVNAIISIQENTSKKPMIKHVILEKGITFSDITLLKLISLKCDKSSLEDIYFEVLDQAEKNRFEN